MCLILVLRMSVRSSWMDLYIASSRSICDGDLLADTDWIVEQRLASPVHFLKSSQQGVMYMCQYCKAL